jgi:hypothetical protein
MKKKIIKKKVVRLESKVFLIGKVGGDYDLASDTARNRNYFAKKEHFANILNGFCYSDFEETTGILLDDETFKKFRLVENARTKKGNHFYIGRSKWEGYEVAEIDVDFHETHGFSNAITVIAYFEKITDIKMKIGEVKKFKLVEVK